MSTADPNCVVLTGENPFIRLSETDDDAYTTNASFWRVLFSPAGPGHVLYVKSELTENRWRIYADNIGSVQAFVRAGWRQEAILRRHYMHDDGPMDIVLMGLCADEANGKNF